jgi:hypothetical protein
MVELSRPGTGKLNLGKVVHKEMELYCGTTITPGGDSL